MYEYKYNFDPQVAGTRVLKTAYMNEPQHAEDVFEALGKVAAELDWSDERLGPLGNVIAKDARVLIKPNFVRHENEGPWGMDPMVTHQSVVTAVARAALMTAASEVLVGDAPLQSCDFDQLLKVTNLDHWSAELKEKDSRFKGIRDFRRTTCEYIDGVRVASEDLISEAEFVLFDLGSESLLEPITNGSEEFRVTCYDPRLMAKTHAPGRHRYLVSKNVIEADVVINLPKLKTHKKAGITCALKNLIGINGNKEYLPHHRLGGANLGGDCYPGDSKVKRILEYAADQQNLADSRMAARVWGGVTTRLNQVLHLMGDNLGIEGSWSGNDTIWRTALDLNRILIYGRLDGTMADTPQRRVIHIVDAIVAGQGDGPLAPQPLDLSLLFAGSNAACVDLVGAQLLGYHPERLSLVREAFGDFRWPVAASIRNDVKLLGDFPSGRDIPEILYPEGWRDAAARQKQGTSES